MKSLSICPLNSSKNSKPRPAVFKRIEKAKKLLMLGEKSLIEIALETDFSSQSYFTKIFKEQTGITPAMYQKELSKPY